MFSAQPYGNPLSLIKTAATSANEGITTKSGSSADTIVANVIEGKRSRRPNPKYAQVAWTREETDKILKSHASFNGTRS